MFKVFIAEDELLIRDSLRELLVELEPLLDISYCGEAGDGELALSMMQELKPDILLTDIKMPFMDGLSLAKYAKELFPWLRSIIISGVQDLTYFQEAIKVGVDGYLLKPVFKADLIDILESTLEKIKLEKERQSKPQEAEETRHQIYYQEHFMRKLAAGGYQVQGLYERQEQLKFQFIGQQFGTLAVQIDTQELLIMKDLILKLQDVFYQDTQILFGATAPNQILSIISGATQQEMIDKTYYLADILNYELQKLDLNHYLILIGKTSERISSLAQTLAETKTLASDLTPQGGKKIVTLEEIQETKSLIEIDYPSISQIISDQSLTIAEKTTILTTPTSEEFATLSQEHYRNLVLKLLRYEIAANASIKDPTLLTEYSDEKLLMIAQTPSLFQFTTTLFLEQGEKYTQVTEPTTKNERLVKTCREYIQQHYSDPNLSLQVMAEEVGISATYLSTIFSQQVGTTFIEYLTQARINQAKRLLSTTNKRITDITFDIGYNDPNYLSFTFKKRVGQTPKEYRKNQEVQA